eukprot:523374-Pleurochrysis_carterae.AAC.1
MASTSAPRARSSASKVDCARPSPENAISARHSPSAPPPAAGPSPSPAGGVAATGPPVCQPRLP